MSSVNNPLFKNENTVAKMSKTVKSGFMERIDFKAASGLGGGAGTNHKVSGGTEFYQPGGNQTGPLPMKSPRRAMDM